MVPFRRVRLAVGYVVAIAALSLLLAVVLLGWRSFHYLSGWDRSASTPGASFSGQGPQRIVCIWQGFGDVRLGLKDFVAPPGFFDGKTGMWQSDWRWIDLPTKGVPVVDNRMMLWNGSTDWRFFGLGVWSDKAVNTFRRVAGVPYALIAAVLVGVAWGSLRSIIRLRRQRAGQCIKCVYDLAGLAEGPCPECGTGPNGRNAPARPAS